MTAILEAAVDEPISMFPEDFPVLPPKAKKPFKPHKHQETILEAFRRYGPLDERGLFEKAFVGVITAKSVSTHLDGLIRNGMVKDTGQRGDWTKKGRRIVWDVA